MKKAENWSETVDRLLERLKKQPKKKNVRERSVAAYLKKRIKEENGRAWKIRGEGVKGVSDYLIALNGLWACEAKRPVKGKYSGFQDIFKKQVEDRGGKNFRCETNEQVDKMIEFIKLW